MSIVTRRARGRRGLYVTPLLVALAALLLLAPGASATQFQRPLVKEFGSVEQPTFGSPQLITVNQVTGEVLVADRGWNEEQVMTVDATAGTFRLSLEGHTTEDLPFDASAEEVKKALEVTQPYIGVSQSPADRAEGKYNLGFYESYEEQDVEQIVCEDGAVPLTGGSGCSVSTKANGRLQGIYRYHADGTPAPFAALGSEYIDGEAGPGDKSCGEEPASCDKTPQSELNFERAGSLAVDPVNGDIYLAQEIFALPDVVDIFSAEGTYLGQLTAAATKFQEHTCGVAVNPAGDVYVPHDDKISKFVPSANPPVNSDNTANFKIEGEHSCKIAFGSGPSAGWLFIHGGHYFDHYRTLKVNEQTGSVQEFSAEYAGFPTVDPTSGNLIVGTGEGSASEREFVELDGAAQPAGEVKSRLIVERGMNGANDLAASATGDIYVAASGDPHVLVYGEPVVASTVFAGLATDVTATEATLSGVVGPEGVEVTECFFEWGSTKNGFTNWDHSTPCEETVPTDSGEHEVHARISGLVPNGSEYSFRLAAENTNGVTERSTPQTLTSGSLAETKPATVTGLTTATLNGLVHPEGHQYTGCLFEWGLASNPGFEHTASCEPEAGEIPADSDPHAVSAELTGLEAASTYRFRLKAENSEGTQSGVELSFETFGPPRIVAVRASDASQDTARIEAEINPSGVGTSYRFEWGPTASYGNVSPTSFEPIGSGTSRVRVSAELSGLSAATTYHYRVIASNGAGPVQSADHELETLNSCGLPDGRCFEMVSPADPGSVALPGESGSGFEFYSQPSVASGSLAYEAELGFPGATSGGEILYRASRTAGGWESAQYSPSLAGSGQGSGIRAIVLGLSPDLSCGIVSSKIPLTSDPVARVNIEAGGGNLYRRGPDGSYTLITDVPPEVPQRIGEAPAEFQLVGMSPDCERVFFMTEHHYPGIQGVGKNWMYEWNEGKLSYVGLVPGDSGEVAVQAGPGSGNLISGSTYNVVSRDSSRVFFTATSQTGNDSGKQAVFVRIDGEKTLDVSQSTLAVDAGAIYQGATPDGSRVYFLAEAGLTADSSSEGRDLYECHIVNGSGGEPECELTDLSVDNDPGGAEAGGGTGGGVTGSLVGVADDGSHVYFIARGQLVTGQGRTFAENKEANTFSLYVYETASETVRYVGAVDGGKESLVNVTTGNYTLHTAQVSPDGRYLLFESKESLTGYDSGGKQMAYLYDADVASGAESLVCISCRQDGKPSLNPATVLVTVLKGQRSLVIRNGRPLVFFESRDALASGGVDGSSGLYEWTHGQVFHLASDLPGSTPPSAGGTVILLGTNSDATDLYFVNPAALNWENPEARRVVWDARIGGGFPEPTTAFDCDPGAEGSCQQGGGPPPSAPSAGTATFEGPGNVQAKKHKKARHRKRAHKHKHKHKRKRKGRHGKSRKKQANRHARHANAERRAGK